MFAVIFVGQQQPRAFEGFDRLSDVFGFGFGVFAAESAGGAIDCPFAPFGAEQIADGGDALFEFLGQGQGAIVLRSAAPRDVFAWKRGETTATAGQLMGLNGLTAENLVKRAIAPLD
ncbi:MAG: hypothetical protein BJG00_016905 [Limnothrix sp. CACIAM 69d]|nr:MAG: hypothetical protein BJG00_016905 [Limnothrix sp. CACIAM 69d]